MKLDRLQIKLIIGLIFVIFVGILVFFFQMKSNSTINNNKYIQSNMISNDIYINQINSWLLYSKKTRSASPSLFNTFFHLTIDFTKYKL